MPTLTFVSPAGQRTPCQAAAGSSVMLAALVNGVDGVLAECGGSLACGTCHVYVEPSQLALFDAASEAELAMLEATASPRLSNSRLSCQLRLPADADGVVVYLPPTQV